MSKDTLIDPVAFLISHILRLFTERHNISIETLLAIDEEKDILGYIKNRYEPFHLTGDEGVLDELDDYIGSKLLEQFKFDDNSGVISEGRFSQARKADN